MTCTPLRWANEDDAAGERSHRAPYPLTRPLARKS